MTFTNVWHTQPSTDCRSAAKCVLPTGILVESHQYTFSHEESWNHFTFRALWLSLMYDTNTHNFQQSAQALPSVYYRLVSWLKGISTHFQMMKVETIFCIQTIMTFTKCVLPTSILFGSNHYTFSKWRESNHFACTPQWHFNKVWYAHNLQKIA